MSFLITAFEDREENYDIWYLVWLVCILWAFVVVGVAVMAGADFESVFIQFLLLFNLIYFY